MRNRWLLNLVLLLAVLLLGWLALGEKKGQQDSLAPLVDIDPLSITSLRIEHENQPVIDLQKQADQWHMRAPYQALANNSHINKLLSVVETPSHATFASDRDLQQYGLVKPKVHLVMNDTLRISFGDVEPLGKRRYVRIDDSVHVIGDSPFAQLTAAASLLVDTALFGKGANISMLALPGVTLEKQPDGKWKTSTGGDYSADAVNIYIDEWQHARAVFVSDPEKPQAGEQFITVSMTDGSSFRFGVIKLNTGVTLVNQQTGLHYHLAADVGEQLLTPPEPLN